MITAAALWAKLKRDDQGTIVGWHSLVAHSAEVAAVFGVLLLQPTIEARLLRLAERDAFDHVTHSRLCALAFLHDFGKANRGFRARVDQRAPTIGHIQPVAWLFCRGEASDLLERVMDVLELDKISGWLAPEGAALFDAVFAHHGRPWDPEPVESRTHWRTGRHGDPIADLHAVTLALHRHYPAAFEEGPVLPSQPAFLHAFAGLLMLADWLASDTAFFPMRNGAEPSPAEAWDAARTAVATSGLNASVARKGFRPANFAEIFGYLPRGLQAQAASPSARCVVLEAETGSGKTEAALWRFKTLFEQGEVDGLYFALPTRVAATAMFARVKAFRDAVFGGTPPAVVLAVPGQAAIDDAEGRPLPHWGFEWTDHPEGNSVRQRWAAEHPKRFLAAPIAVGTIDQALLGAIRVKHSQMRGAALLRNLLVVDEVHASDPYMTVLLGALLRNHLRAGGHALLLSATLGAAARSTFLGTPCPPPDAAEAVAYPALSWSDEGQCLHLSTEPDPARRKTVKIVAHPWMDRLDDVAGQAIAAANAGAKVLIIRNTVRDAIQTMQAIERTAPDNPALFQVAGLHTVHHGRFAQPDRRALDQAVEAALGRGRAEGGRIVVGTQTLEVSLDLDADLLVTDLCPADVLLQRIGRLHRHARYRPPGFEVARAIVLVPQERDLVRFTTRHGGRHGLGRVYDDLRTIEATWRLIEASPDWVIPDDNRRLVERTTHPAHLERIEAELSLDDAAWTAHLQARSGRGIAQVNDALQARLDWSMPFEDLHVPADELISTRLGAKDRQVDLPREIHSAFDLPIERLRIPHFMLDGIPAEAEPTDVIQDVARVEFRMGDRIFSYSAFGLQAA